MIRVVWIFIIVAVLATIAAWLADQPGAIAITWRDYQIDTSFGVGAFLVLLLVLAVLVGALILSLLVRAPRKIQSFNADRRRRRGYAALSKGMLAVAAGDTGEAKRLARRARSLLDEPPLTLLLAAQAAQLEGNQRAAETYFSAMLENDETEFLGLRGLFIQAMRRGDPEAALEHAQRAGSLRPDSPWVLNALFDLQTQSAQWDGAAKTLKRSTKVRMLTEDVARRRRAVILAAQAQEREHENPEQAMRLAQDAVGLAPGLVPAATLAAKLLGKAGRVWKASAILETAWSQAPHPLIATVFEALKSDESDELKRKRLMSLAEMNPSHADSHVLIAQRWFAEKEYSKARKALASLVESRPSAQVCQLMADIEQLEGDEFKARDWLARAALAPRNAEWCCQACHHSVSDWAAVCATCGAFDSIVWLDPADLMLPVAGEAAESDGAVSLRQGSDSSLPLTSLQPVADFLSRQKNAVSGVMVRTRARAVASGKRAGQMVQAVSTSTKNDIKKTGRRIAAAFKNLSPPKTEKTTAQIVQESSETVPEAPPAPAYRQPDDPGPEGETLEEPAKKNAAQPW
jgi:HemY protein